MSYLKALAKPEVAFEGESDILVIYEAANLLKSQNLGSVIGSKNIKKNLFNLILTVINLNKLGYFINFVGFHTLCVAQSADSLEKKLKIFKLDQLENMKNSELRNAQNLNSSLLKLKKNLKMSRNSTEVKSLDIKLLDYLTVKRKGYFQKAYKIFQSESSIDYGEFVWSKP